MAFERISPPTDPAVIADADRRMADVAALANGVVHDIRNPLNVIRTNLYLLRKWVPAEEPRASRSLERIDDQVTVALRLLEGLQAFYRTEQAQHIPVDLNQVATEVANTTSIPDGYTLELELAPGLRQVTGDPALLQTAVRLLVRNAIEAMGEGGPIRIITGHTGTRATLTVADEGEGLSAEARERAFEPFFTTRRARGGIGLPLVARIMRAVEGTVYVEALERGTRVVLEFQGE